MKKGLVMEGGAMRGMFTAGVIDVMMEHQITFDGAMGVSAGAVFGCNYKSNQPGRVIRYNAAYCNKPQYAGLRTTSANWQSLPVLQRPRCRNSAASMTCHTTRRNSGMMAMI